MKNRGYAVSAIIYPLLLLSLILILSIIYNLNGKYEILKIVKNNVTNETEIIPSDYDAVIKKITYNATGSSSTYNATATTSTYTCNQPFTNREGPFQDGTYNFFCKYSHITNTKAAALGGNCQHKITGTSYSCPNGGTLSGTTCTKTTYSCPNGGTLNGTICSSEEYTCPNGGTLNGIKCIYSNKNLKDSILRDNTILTVQPTLTKTSSDAGDESGLYYSNDTNSGRTTYYFRGNVNNYVKFAGYTWRIIRINEDGTVRMIMTEGINDNTGYPYVTENADNYLASYYTNSAAKKELENWYNSKLVEYDSYISENEYCEAARVRINSEHSEKLNNVTLSLNEEYHPTFKCEKDANNYGIVKSKIGLITADEVMYAGGYADKINLDYYLNMSNTKHILTMSASGLRTASNIYDIWFINNWSILYNGWKDRNGKLSVTVSNETGKSWISSLVPVINIYSTVKVSGTGTETDPYIVK